MVGSKGSRARDPLVQETIAHLRPPSRNRIHEDETARRYSFGGALVPSVSIYAHISRLLLEHFRDPFLERGQADVRFLSPL